MPAAAPSQNQHFKPIYAAFAKIDEEARMVFGYASTETRDQQGEIIRLSAIDAALPDYMKFANVREMHQPWAVGTAVEAAIDGTGFWFGAHVVDDDAWKKVKAKVYKGFSIGGRVTERDTVDRSVVTGLELTEVSLVDRPANPDAVYTVVKRVDGKLWEQPLQKWDCGVADHQHRAKTEASDCMANRARDLQKRAGAAATASVTLTAAAETLSSSEPIEKQDLAAKGPAKDLVSGKFSSHARMATENHKKRAQHDRQAAKARDEQRQHRDAASRALKAGDATAVALHEHLAGAAASLAESHGRAAEKYREIAARHESAMGKINMEAANKMRTIQEATDAAEAAMAELRKAVSPEAVEKSDHVGGAREAREQALDHLKSATASEQASAASREAARSAKKDGMADDANEHNAKADVADITAVGHHEVGDTLHELHAHHMEKAVSIEGVNHEEHAALAKSVGGTHAEQASHAETVAKMHDGYSTGAIAKSAEAGHHAEMATRMRKVAANRTALSKRMQDCAAKSMECHAAKVAKAARETMVEFLSKRFGGDSITKLSDEEVKKKYDAAIAEDAKADEAKKAAAAKAAIDEAKKTIKPITGLKLTPDGWVDATGVSFFGKREIKDDARVELVVKGLALADGSFPVETKEDLVAAVAAIEKAADQVAVKDHLKKAAVALKAEDVIPADWTKAAEPEAKKVAAVPEAAIKERAVALAKAAGKTEADAKEFLSKAESELKGERRVVMISKGMGIVACLAEMYERIEMLRQSSAMEEALEGDDSTEVTDAIDALCAAAANALRITVDHETTEGDDIDAIALAAVPAMAKAGGREPMLVVARKLRDMAMEKGVESKRRVAMKRLADAFEKGGEAEAKEFYAKLHDRAVASGATCAAKAANAADIEKAVSERNIAIASLEKTTETMKAMAKQAEVIRIENAGLRKANAELTEKVAKLGAMPEPQKGLVGTRAISKAEDTANLEAGDTKIAGGEKKDIMQKASEAAPGHDRANALIKLASEVQGQTLTRERK